MGRLGNLGMSYCSLTALLDTYPTAECLADETAVKAVALFDNEEVGSDSAQGEHPPKLCSGSSACRNGCPWLDGDALIVQRLWVLPCLKTFHTFMTHVEQCRTKQNHDAG